MELKCRFVIFRSCADTGSNRTFMELKFNKVKAAMNLFCSSNRTFMELKSTLRGSML